VPGWSLHHRAFLITGGARGIGAATAQALHAGAYAATKAGVEALANALRTEVAASGVDVGTIHPIWIDTDMVREADATTAA
jgi:NAD(P)-dependent dehydrogenase (short-subunit alcohol dehydrogenase family)